jgi:alpha-tubulin suppressor-like RCC1 family protein
MRAWVLGFVLVSGCRTIDFPAGTVAAPVIVETVSWGTHHACAMSTAGGPVCWGHNAGYELGASIGDRSAVPVAPELGGIRLDTIVAGHTLTCGLDGERRAWCWGGSVVLPRSMAEGRRFQELKGGVLVCGRDEDDLIWCWGLDTDLAAPVAGTAALGAWDVGTLGCGLLADSTAACWSLESPLTAVPGGMKFRTISAGGGHACGMGTDYVARCWGSDGGGALGNGGAGDSGTPVAVSPIPGATLVQVHAGSGFSCGVADNGRAYCWGIAGYGQLGIGYFAGIETLEYHTPVGVAPSRIFVGPLVVGHNSTCGFANDGLLYCWGRNEFFMFGSGPEPYEYSPWPALSVAPFVAEEAP